MCPSIELRERARLSHFPLVVIDFQWLALTALWSRAIDVNDLRPLTRSAALAALAVGSEDCRRRELGIPSIFEPPPLVLTGRGAP
jgi:hypothetical protein